MKYLTVQEIADRWQVNTVTVRNYIKDGKLDAIRLNKDFRVELTVIEEFERDHHFKIDRRD